MTDKPDQTGLGDWRAFSLPLDKVMQCARDWKAAVAGIECPWLCWHVNDRWTAIQTALVRQVGWTPVVGYDPRFGAPTIAIDGVVIDFNRHLNLSLMYMHFPLEFVFLWVPRLAFWHSDLLCRIPVMQHLANQFRTLKPGEMAAIKEYGGDETGLTFAAIAIGNSQAVPLPKRVKINFATVLAGGSISRITRIVRAKKSVRGEPSVIMTMGRGLCTGLDTVVVEWCH